MRMKLIVMAVIIGPLSEIQFLYSFVSEICVSACLIEASHVPFLLRMHRTSYCIPLPLHFSSAFRPILLQFSSNSFSNSSNSLRFPPFLSCISAICPNCFGCQTGASTQRRKSPRCRGMCTKLISVLHHCRVTL